jgi:exopolysaccharide production protein ExoZ
MQTDPQASVVWWWRGAGQAGAAGDVRARAGARDAGPSAARRVGNYESIQYLRGISAVMVIFYHAAIQSAAISGLYVPTSGKFGVDIFFVISGFVMWTGVSGRRTNPVIFLKKRFCRIVPLYWGFTLIAALIALLMPGLLRSTIFSLPHLAASLAFIPWINPAASSPELIERLTPVVTPGWTLNFEMLFYAMFASILMLPRYLMFLALCLEMVLLHYCAVALGGQTPLAQFYAQGVMFEFLFGVAVAILNAHYRPPMRLIAVALVLAALPVLLWADLVQPVESRWLWLGIPAAVLVAALVGMENAGWMPRADWLGRIGAGTYSIYLSHVFVIAAARIVIQLSGAAGWMMQPLVFVPLAIVASVGVGMCVHYRIERPVTAWWSRALGVA